MFNINSTENSGVKNNHEIEWDRMNLLCKSFFDANCLNNGGELNSEEGDISSNCEENIDHSTKSQSLISKKFVEPKSNVIHDDTLYDQCESFDDKNPATTDLIELCLTDSDYLRAKNRWFDFSETELDFASAERMNYINLLTECISNRNFGEHSSNAKKLNSNFEKSFKKEQNKDSRLFSKTQDKPVRKFEFCIMNDEENKYEKGDDAVDNMETRYPVLKNKDGRSTSMGNHANSIINNNNNNKCSVYQAHCGDDDHSNQFHNHEKKVVTNVFRLGVESTKIPIEQVVDLKQSLIEKEKTTDSACCMKSQTENEEIRKRLENLERIMLAKINSYQFGSSGCGESSLLIGEQIGLQTNISTNNRVKLPDKDEPEIFPCRKFGLHKFHNNLRKCGHDKGKTLEKLQMATNDDGLETADVTITNKRDPSHLKCQEGVLRIKRKNSLEDLRGSQRISFADSWSEFEIENIFENDRWLKGSLSSTSSSSKRSYVTSDYTLIRRRKKYHSGKRRRRNRKSRKDETLEKFCHQTNKRRAANSEKQQSVKSKEFSSDEKEKKYYEETIPSTPTVKGSRIKQYCVIL